jgi:carbon storage regulator CsrA
MLVLRRFEGEEVIITTKHGEIIRVAVTRVKQSKGKSSANIGIDAGESTAIYRKELYDAIQRDKEPK